MAPKAEMPPPLRNYSRSIISVVLGVEVGFGCHERVAFIYQQLRAGAADPCAGAPPIHSASAAPSGLESIDYHELVYQVANKLELDAVQLPHTAVEGRPNPVTHVVGIMLGQLSNEAFLSPCYAKLMSIDREALELKLKRVLGVEDIRLAEYAVNGDCGCCT
jgi:hypothetical protein